jgi:hypothetical protein
LASKEGLDHGGCLHCEGYYHGGALIGVLQLVMVIFGDWQWRRVGTKKKVMNF